MRVLVGFFYFWGITNLYKGLAEQHELNVQIIDFGGVETRTYFGESRDGGGVFRRGVGPEGGAWWRGYSQRTETPGYCAIFSSPVTNVIFSTKDCAISNRSKGSRCIAGNSPTGSVWAMVIGRCRKPFRVTS